MQRDPVTNAPLPADAIQRVLYLTPSVHIFRIPPITSNKGFNAASWTQNPADLIFTARIRILETAVPDSATGGEKVSTTILLEEPKTGELFAAAPYTHPSVVEQALDSSRFFAIRVVGGGSGSGEGEGAGMKATLGLGFEQRPDAFDFGVALQDVRRVMGMDGSGASAPVRPGQRVGMGAVKGAAAGKAAETKQEPKMDFSLKEGETITLNIGGKSRKSTTSSSEGATSGTAWSSPSSSSSLSGGNLFVIPPPPGGSGKSSSTASFPILAPPPSASSVKAEMKRRSQEIPAQPTAEDLGFDDGEFGEFQ